MWFPKLRRKIFRCKLRKKNNKKKIRPPDMPQCPTGAMEPFSEFESRAGSGRCGG